MTPGKVLVLVPTYNEVQNIEPLLNRIHTSVPTAHVLVIDDASPDGTGELVDKLSAVESWVSLLPRPGKQGLGVAYLAGYAWGMARPFDAFVQMDADGSHQPEQLPSLLRALGTADLVLGSRWVPGGSVVHWPWPRKLLSRGGNAYARLLLGLPVRDATGGYRAVHRRALERLDLSTVASAGYCFQVDVVRRAAAAGIRVVEVPITFVERRHGTSKMDRSVVAESLLRVTGWGLTTRMAAIRRVPSMTARSPS